MYFSLIYTNSGRGIQIWFKILHLTSFPPKRPAAVSRTGPRLPLWEALAYTVLEIMKDIFKEQFNNIDGSPGYGSPHSIHVETLWVLSFS